jgi:hypothetical protein
MGRPKGSKTAHWVIDQRRVRHAGINKGWYTKSAIAKGCDVSLPTLYRAFHNLPIELEMVERLAKGLGLKVEEFSARLGPDGQPIVVQPDLPLVTPDPVKASAEAA